MSIIGKLIGTVIDVATTPIAIAKDVIPGCGGYIDGDASKTGRKADQIARDLKEVREALEDL